MKIQQVLVIMLCVTLLFVAGCGAQKVPEPADPTNGSDNMQDETNNESSGNYSDLPEAPPAPPGSEEI